MMAEKPTSPNGKWANRIVGAGEEAPDQLLANPANFRIHPAMQQAALEGSLDTLGWVQQVLVNRQSGNVIDGHLRVALALRHNQPLVPVLYVDLTEDEERQALLSLDPVAAMAATDRDKLQALLQSVQSDDERVQAMMKEIAERERIPFGPEPPEDPGAQMDRAEELREKWGVELGQLWQLGEHRLICGDCTDRAVVERILDIQPGMMVTDPPYGVEYDPGWRNEAAEKGLISFAARREGKVENDERADWSDAWILFLGDVAYCWHSNLHASTVELSFRQTGFEPRSHIVWAKDNFAISRGHYHWKHELCIYFVRKGKSANWIGGRAQTTLWEIGWDKNIDGGHGTQKPLECMERPIRNHRFDAIYDPFLGSGTTLVACERLGRIGRGVEISPAYVAVSLQRLADIGLEPKLVET